MTFKMFRPAAVAALLGCSALAVQPALAAVPLARADSVSAPVAASAAYGDDWGRGWKRDRRNWGDGWGRGDRRWRNDGVSAGDVLAGVLVIGTIAAIASAASKANKNNDYDEAPPPPPAKPGYGNVPGGYPGGGDDGYPGDYGKGSAKGPGIDDDADFGSDYADDAVSGLPAGKNDAINSAVEACTGELGKGSAEVDTVDNVEPVGKGWRVEGQTTKGKAWTCEVDTQGKIRDLRVDGFAY